MSELFEFGVCFEVKGGQISNRYEEITEAQADYIEDATNNHDRLEQENAELKEELQAKTDFLGLVVAEKVGLEQEVSELRAFLESLQLDVTNEIKLEQLLNK